MCVPSNDNYQVKCDQCHKVKEKKEHLRKHIQQNNTCIKLWPCINENVYESKVANIKYENKCDHCEFESEYKKSRKSIQQYNSQSVFLILN